MSGKAKQKKKNSGQRTNFLITLISVSVIFIFFGYLIGQYAVQALQERHQSSMQYAQEGGSTPVVTRDPSPAPAPTPAPPSPTMSTQSAPQVAQSETPQSTEALYRVQVGVFSERANADRMVAMLKDEGYEGIIIPGPPHRVQTGAFGSQENAARLVEELVQKGFEAIIVR